MKPTPAQQEAIDSYDNNLLLIAGAGSGKTATVIQRIKVLIERGVNPASILCLTFTRKAANEIRERLEKMLDPRSVRPIWIGTFHSISYRILSQWGYKIGYKSSKKESISVTSQKEADTLLKAIVDQYDFKSSMKKITDAKGLLAHDNIDPVDPDIKRILKEYKFRLKESNAVDFDYLLLEVHDLFQACLDALKYYQGKFEHVFIDEYQDTDTVQYNLHELIQPRNLFCIGDSDQCQPAGTMVVVCPEPDKRKKDLIEIPIEELDPKKHELVSYDVHGGCVVGLQKGYNFEIASREYSGNMLTISTGDKQTKCTPDHKWLVRWNTKDTKFNIVYLMKSGKRWRIGWCQLFRGDGQFHLSQRARLEKADCAWILKIVDNKQDAYMWETILAAQYGIPQIPFRPIECAQYINEECIAGVFDGLCSRVRLDQRAEFLLKAFNRQIDYPTWQAGEELIRGVRKRHIVHACNLLPECMEIPTFNYARNAEWKTFSVDAKEFSGTVYSLKVAKYEMYIADGLITHNCLYSWRGANISIILNFDKMHENTKVIKLEHCFRCGDNIVAAANTLIDHNVDRIKKTLIGATGFDGEINILEDSSAHQVAHFLAEELAFENPSQIAVIARNHRSLEFIERACQEYKLDVLRVGKATDEVESMDCFKFMLAYLKLQLNPLNNISFLMANKIGFKTVLPEIWKKANEAGCSWYQAFEDKAPINHEQDIQSFYRQCCTASNQGASTLVIEYLVNMFDKDISAENWLKQYQVKDSHLELEKKKEGMITLITAHAAKGLEWDNVLIADFEELKFPSKLAIKNNTLEEERRLAYVAFTRARKRLVIFSSPNLRSRFLHEAKLPAEEFKQTGQESSENGITIS